MKPWMNCLVSSMPPCTSRSIERLTIMSKARHIWPMQFMQWIDAAGAEAVLGRLVPRALLAERVLERDAHVVEDDLAVVAAVACPQTGTLRMKFQPGVSVGTMICVMRLVDVRVAASSVRHITIAKCGRLGVRREPLVAVDHPLVAVAHGARSGSSGDRSPRRRARSSRSRTAWFPRRAARATSSSAPGVPYLTRIFWLPELGARMPKIGFEYGLQARISFM